MTTNMTNEINRSTADHSALIQRMERLESQLAFQEDTIEQLNQQITQLNLNQSMLERKLLMLAERFKEQKTSNIASEADETPPPHY